MNIAPTGHHEYVRCEVAMHCLGISKAQMSRLATEGRLRVYHIGTVKLCRRSEIVAYLDRAKELLASFPVSKEAFQ